MDHARKTNAVNRVSPEKALMSVAVMAALADGRVRPSELERLRRWGQDCAVFDRVASLDALILECVENVRTRGEDVSLRVCAKSLGSGLRETAYAWAVDVIQADGGHHQDEHVFLDRLGRALTIPGPLAAKIRAVTAIRRRTA
jgi:tellurite resistance protein